MAAAAELNLPTLFFDADELNRAAEEYHLAESAFVKKTTGAGNVAEAAAICAGGGKFALAKTKFTKVTVALLWEK